MTPADLSSRLRELMAEADLWVKNLEAAGGNQGSFTDEERVRFRALADLLTRLNLPTILRLLESVDEAEKALGEIMKPVEIRSIIGPLHAAGMSAGLEHCRAIASPALATLRAAREMNP